MKKEFDFESFDLVVYVFQKRLPLFIITSLGAIAAIIVAFMITPKFESSVVLFPTHSSSVAKNLLSSTQYSRGITEFGDEEDSEKLLQVLNSNDIREKIVTKFNLMEHYGIDPKSGTLYTELYSTFSENIKFSRTEFMSVQISVMDTDAQMAADIANSIPAFVDTAINHLKKERAFKALSLIEREYNALENKLKTLEDSLQTLQKLGVVNYEAQTEMLTKGYADAQVQNNMRAARELDKELKIVEKYGGAYRSVLAMITSEEERFMDLRDKYLEARLEATEDLPNVFIVNKAGASERKTYPVRSFIVMITTIISFLFGFVALLFWDRYKFLITNK